MAITLERAKQNLEYWLQADEALAQGKTMTINGRSITLPSADEVSKRIDYWERKIVSISSTSTMVAGSKKQSGVCLASFND